MCISVCVCVLDNGQRRSNITLLDRYEITGISTRQLNTSIQRRGRKVDDAKGLEESDSHRKIKD